MCQPENPTISLGQQLNHCQEWASAFSQEWYRLAEGCADLEQTADAAAELYRVHWARDAAEVAREEWGQPA